MTRARTPEDQKIINHLTNKQRPEWWVETHLSGKLWPKQVEILRSIKKNRRTAVRSCHGAGKTHLAARASLQFGCCHPYSIVITTAPTGRQVRKLLWQELRRAHSTALRPLGGKLNLTDLTFEDGWYLFGFATDEPTSFQGIHPSSGHILIIVDEASGVADEIWEAIDAVMSSGGARLLSIGNPTDPNSRFAQEFKTPGVEKIKITAFDTPNLQGNGIVIPGLVTQEWVDDIAARYGEESSFYISRVLADFPELGDDTLFPLSWIERAMAREIEPKATDPKALGVDVALFGGDETVIATRHGPRVRLVECYRNQDTMATAGRAKIWRRDFGAEVIGVDANGIGAGVHDRLIEDGEPSEPINVGTRAHDPERYFNRRTELYWAVRERLKSGDCDLPQDDLLCAQMSAIRYRVNGKGQIQVESKDDMRKRLKHRAGVNSPDRADAVVLAYAARSSSLISIDNAISFG